MSRHHPRTPHAQRRCMLCDATSARGPLRAASSLRPSLADYIRDQQPTRWHDDGWICAADLNRNRVGQAIEQLRAERGELSAIEAEIAHKAADHMTVAEDLESAFRKSATRGQRIADQVARVGGSWAFVLGFLGLIVAWIVFNSLVLATGAFDPFPYILLNLVLSCVAAIQAPVIMMSQNRAYAHDRSQADQDFRVNLKAELEVASLHEKLDHLLHTQWDRLIELQEVQLELLTELAGPDRPRQGD